MLQNKVRVKRAEYNLTQTDLADRVSVTRQTIAFIEKGEFAPSITLGLKLARALRTPVAELFWLEEEPDEKTI
ncbi:anaerobic benzoate catabolism transcriptional regulator [compost metagenome]